MLLLPIFLGGIVACAGMHVLFKSKVLDVVSALLLVGATVPATSLKYSIPESASYVICNIEYVYYGFLMYFSAFCLIIFGIKLIKRNFQYRKYLLASFIGTLSILTYGYLNALSPVVHKIKLRGPCNIRICFLSDIHIGFLSAEYFLKIIPKMINSQNPDVVIFGGDMIDHLALTKYKDEFIQSIKSIRSKHGVYAVFGNHEVYCGIEKAGELLGNSEVNILADTSCNIDGKICILGRRDACDSERKPLSDIYPDTKLPVLIIDHNPFCIKEAAEYKPFAQLSGHTHNGQMFPNHIIVNKMYGFKTGKMLNINGMHAYISPGFGYSRVPFRVGTTPEMVVLDIENDVKAKSIWKAV